MIDRPGLFGAIANGPLVLDAAMGTRLIARGLSLQDDDPSLWNLTHPDIVAEFHCADVESGAGALVTNTFGANRGWLGRFGRAVDLRRINESAVRIVRESADCRFLFGSIGPTALERPDDCREQAQILVDSGVDALFLETLRADQAVNALERLGPEPGVPVVLSLFDWPDPIGDLARRLEERGASVLGVNCVPMTRTLRLMERLAGSTNLPLLVKPSAGSHEGSETFAAAVPALLKIGVRLIGGCCGTTERHVAAIKAACYDRREKLKGQGRSESL